MSKEHEIALRIINEKIDAGESFAYTELTHEIIDAGGILRTSIGVTIRDYIETLMAIGLLRYNPLTDKYDIQKNVLEELADRFKKKYLYKRFRYWVDGFNTDIPNNNQVHFVVSEELLENEAALTSDDVNRSPKIYLCYHHYKLLGEIRDEDIAVLNKFGLIIELNDIH